MSVTGKLATAEQQRELFLWKFRDVNRPEVNDMLKEFKKHDLGHKGELDEHEAMMLLEHRGQVRTARELREAIGDMDKDHNHKLSFIEWLCFHFKKSFEDLNNFVDEEARAKAMEEAMKYGEEARLAEEEIQKAAELKEVEAQLRAAQLEEESKLTGVAGMRAFFFRKVESVQDVTKTNEQTIKEEAARRKALREAKTKMNEAIENANKSQSAEEVAAEMKRQTELQARLEAEAAAKKEADDKAARAARKAALNAKWSGGEVDKVTVKKRLSITSTKPLA